MNVKWIDSSLAPEMVGSNLVWVSFSGEVHICVWDEERTDGFNWRSCWNAEDHFRVEGSVWGFITYPKGAENVECD